MLRYAKSLVSWIGEEATQISSIPKAKPIKKTRNPIRRRNKNRNPFFKFLRKLRQVYPGLNAVELSSLGSMVWERMNEDEKRAYFNHPGARQLVEDSEEIQLSMKTGA